MLKKLIYLSLLSWVLIPGIAISEDTCPAEKKPTGPWTSKFSLAYNKTSGNSDVSLLNLGLVSNYEKDKNLFRFQADHSFGESESVTTGEKETTVDYSFGSAEYKRILADRLYAGIGTDYLRNEVADVKYRVFLNPKIGYFVYKEENVGSWDVYAGPSYLWEQVGGIQDDYLAPKIGNRLEYQITDTAKIFEAVDVYLSADEGDNYLVQAEAGLETKISESLNLVFKVRDLYDNQPAAGNQKNDLALLTGVGIDF